MSSACAVCQTTCPGSAADYQNVDCYECPRCGDVRAGPSGKGALKRLLAGKPEWFPDALSHALRQFTELRGFIFVTAELLDTLRNERLAPLIQQANNLILWIGGRLEDPAMPWSATVGEWASIVGGRAADDSIGYLLQHSAASGWLDSNYLGRGIGDNRFHVRLTFQGWHRFDELQRLVVESRTGFMAMPFGIPEITTVYQDCFKKAAEDAGFDLRILTEAQGAGLIDDQLRVAIRTAKFLIADISSGNRGAYWEAGFVEGLGRPVIYTCRADILKNKTHEHHPHFDTNHMNTVPWMPDNLLEARLRLTATIRNTFPTEALMPSA